MPLSGPEEQRQAHALAKLAFVNPFAPGRVDLEREALGLPAGSRSSPLHLVPGKTPEEAFPNLSALRPLAKEFAETMRERLRQASTVTDADLTVYRDICLYSLYNEHVIQLDPARLGKPRTTADLWSGFLRQLEHYSDVRHHRVPWEGEPEHLLSVMVQIWRAFNSVFDIIVGESDPLARLRAAVWESIFTHDLRRYARAMHADMPTIPTLITGPSGTGKELVAKAIASSRYVPFDAASQRFERFDDHLYSVNLSALAPTLVESELFGHVKGSFTGAVRDHAGHLEQCGAHGTVFVDEIGELDPAIQVKLLRVLQERTFQRIGDPTEITFSAKILAATNRDLRAEMQSGSFREDFYYRLCGDVITTPSLREQLDDSPNDLPNLVRYILSEHFRFPTEEESEAATREVVTQIRESIPPDYAWPGNFRELEQCTRNILIRGSYTPAESRSRHAPGDDATRLSRHVLDGTLSSDELLRQYYTRVYQRTGSYRKAAKVLEVDWRTVKERVDPELLRELEASRS